MGLMLFPSIMFIIISILVTVIFVVVIVKLASQWSKNNNSPRLSVNATVVTKRYHRSQSFHGDRMHSTYSTSYYVTFQVESGDRIELYVPSTEYGMLVEGDTGILSFQGTRYLKFERKI